MTKKEALKFSGKSFSQVIEAVHALPELPPVFLTVDTGTPGTVEIKMSVFVEELEVSRERAFYAAATAFSAWVYGAEYNG